MPRLPSVDVVERDTPRPSTGVATRRAGIEQEARAGIGEAVLNIGDAVMKINRELEKSRRLSQLTDAMGKATHELGIVELQFQQDPDFLTSTTRFNEKAEEIRSRYEKNISDPVVRRAFSSKYQKLQQAKDINVRTLAIKKETDYNVAALDSALDSYATQAANSGNLAEQALLMDQARLAIASMRVGGWITEVDARKREKELLAKVDLATVLKDISIDPAMAATRLETSAEYAENLDPVMRERLATSARTRADQVANAQRVEAERQRVQAEREKKQAQELRQNEMLALWNQGKLDTTTVVNDPLMEFSQKHTLINMIEEQTKGGMKTDNAAFISLLNRIHLPEGHKNKITDENELLRHVKAKGGIDFPAFEQLRQEMREMRDPQQGPFAQKRKDFFDMVSSDLTKTNNLAGIKDPKGDQLMYEFMWEANTKIAQWRAAGKDPFELLDPKNPNYLGKLVGSYRRTPLQIIQDMASEIRVQGETKSKADRKPGETAEEYLNRTR